MSGAPSSNQTNGVSIRLAMLHFGRCGSTVVGDLLNQHPALRWDGEVFERAFTGNMRMGRLLLSAPAILLRLRIWRWRRFGYGFETKLHPAYHLSRAVIDMSIARYLDLLRTLGFNLFVVGLEPVPVSVRFTRTNPFSLRETILNWDEVAEVLRGTRYEWMLEE